MQATQWYLNQLSAFDPFLNSTPIINPQALAEAAASDLYRLNPANPVRPLEGVPVVVKDVVNVAGLPTTAGANFLKGFTATSDADMVTKLRSAGAIILGKTNTDTFQAGVEGSSEAFGNSRNPYDITRETGGSSAGSGVAVAANFAMFSIAEETSGSIRFPAQHNGLVGVKPTRTSLSTRGTTGGSLNGVFGPLARTVSDAALAMNVLATPDAQDPYAFAAPSIGMRPGANAYTCNLNANSLSGRRFVVPSFVFNGLAAELELIGAPGYTGLYSGPATTETITAFNAAINEIEALGGTVEIQTFLPLLGGFQASPLASTVLPGENFLRDEFLPTLENGMGQTPLDVIGTSDIGTDPRVEFSLGPIKNGDTLADFDGPAFEQYLNDGEDLYTNVILPLMNSFDAILMPTLNSQATIDDLAPNGVEDVEDLLLDPDQIIHYGLVEGNFIGMPSVSVPMGFTPNGLPLSLQFIGRFWTEPELLGYAFAYEQATNFRRAPDLSLVPEPTSLLLLSAAGLMLRRRRSRSAC